MRVSIDSRSWTWEIANSETLQKFKFTKPYKIGKHINDHIAVIIHNLGSCKNKAWQKNQAEFLSGLNFTTAAYDVLSHGITLLMSSYLFSQFRCNYAHSLPSRPRHVRAFLPALMPRVCSNQSCGTLKCTTRGHFSCGHWRKPVKTRTDST